MVSHFDFSQTWNIAESSPRCPFMDPRFTITTPNSGYLRDDAFWAIGS